MRKAKEIQSERCHLALFGWPSSMPTAEGSRRIVPCPGFIESDATPGTFYPCHECNPNWSRVPAPRKV